MRKHPKAAAGLAATLVAIWLGLPAWGETPPAGAADPWQRLPAILAAIEAPTFPDRDVSILDFGAVGDGESDATAAIREAIAACSKAGGGRVVVPAGDYLTGPIHLQSNVELHLEEGATLRFSQDPNDYLPLVLSRWEGVELMNYSPLVYAFEETNIAVTGAGTLDGQAGPEHWWPWKADDHPQSQRPDRDQLFAQAEAGVPVSERVYGAGHYLRPSFLQPYRSKNVLIEGITIRNAPMWVIHPVLSQNVIVRDVTIISHGPNNDGCNPESSSDVLIEDSFFDTGDDCIAIKSGRNADGRRLDTPSERIVVRGCQMRAGHGGVTIGSEVSGSVRDVFVEQTHMSSPELDRGIRIKTNAVRGGVIENVFVRDVEIGETGAAIHIDMQYEEGADGPFRPVVRNLLIERLTVDRAEHAFFVRGLDVAPVRGLEVRDSVFRAVGSASVLDHLEDLVLRDVVIQPAEESP
ncbi:MAG: glycoside hydrolase family 28 protein [Acidobacteriota bacterium]|nr:glycoside hydrolase family 28 protein [Acidobacteriota bacterium]